MALSMNLNKRENCTFGNISELKSLIPQSVILSNSRGLENPSENEYYCKTRCIILKGQPWINLHSLFDEKQGLDDDKMVAQIEKEARNKRIGVPSLLESLRVLVQSSSNPLSG